MHVNKTDYHNTNCWTLKKRLTTLFFSIKYPCFKVNFYEGKIKIFPSGLSRIHWWLGEFNIVMQYESKQKFNILIVQIPEFKEFSKLNFINFFFEHCTTVSDALIFLATFVIVDDDDAVVKQTFVFHCILINNQLSIGWPLMQFQTCTLNSGMKE